MNAIELLEAILSGGTAAPAESGRPAADPRASSAPRPAVRDEPPPVVRRAPASAGGGLTPAPMPEDEKANLPELLRQAREREAGVASGRSAPASPPARRGWGDVFGLPSRAPEPPPPPPRNEEATILIRAMINAAKADGRLDRDEEQKILRHLGQPSREVVAFIQEEFQKPLDAREFAWSVPIGLEQKVYAMSLSVIDLDQREESAYLKELAHGLRLGADVCAELHQQFGAPLIR